MSSSSSLRDISKVRFNRNAPVFDDVYSESFLWHLKIQVEDAIFQETGDTFAYDTYNDLTRRMDAYMLQHENDPYMFYDPEIFKEKLRTSITSDVVRTYIVSKQMKMGREDRQRAMLYHMRRPNSLDKRPRNTRPEHADPLPPIRYQPSMPDSM